MDGSVQIGYWKAETEQTDDFPQTLTTAAEHTLTVKEHCRKYTLVFGYYCFPGGY